MCYEAVVMTARSSGSSTQPVAHSFYVWVKAEPFSYGTLSIPPPPRLSTNVSISALFFFLLSEDEITGYFSLVNKFTFTDFTINIYFSFYTVKLCIKSHSNNGENISFKCINIAICAILKV